MNDAPPSWLNLGARYLAVTLLLVLWIALGYLLRLDAIVYLILGVPLTLLFQLALRRRPLLALWVREVPPLRFGWLEAAIAIPLMFAPLASLAIAGIEQNWSRCVFALFALVGVVGAIYAVRNFRRAHILPLVSCLAITSALDALQWSLFFGLGWSEFQPVEGGVPERLALGVFAFLQYVVVVFVMEEVAFRMMDSHLQEGSPRRWNLLAALLLGVAWALWHLPISNEELTWESLGILLYVQVPYGLCLSYFWRKTGNLLVPGLAHALGDAVRDALTAAR
jgi:membrane protease YdiL (CAAX protease family)